MNTFTFKIEDMTCNHCVKTMTNAIQQIEPEAKLTADLAHKEVAVETTNDSALIINTLSEAGFTPQLLNK